MTDIQLQKHFIAARRNFISHDFGRLNEMQQKAVMTTDGPLLLLAGAGSGKTTVLINRIANIIKYGSGSDSDYVPEHITEDDLLFLENYLKSPTSEGRDRAEALCTLDPVEPWRIIAITFTNKAAGELKERLESMLGPSGRDVWAMTFHSACVRILRQHIDKLGFDRSFTIYDTSDSQTVMKRILKDLEMDEQLFPYRSVLTQISNAKDGMLSPEDYINAAANRLDARKKMVGEAYAEYAKRLKAANALDFDDLILFAVRLLSEHEDVRDYYQRRFRYVLVDEYQDTNNLQYLLTSLLAGGHENICVVGDDDQSIYKFRGATIENILNFEKQYPGAKTIRLEQNYRSTGYILEASNALIRNNTTRKGKSLWTSQDMGEKLRLHIAPNEREEANYIVGQIIAGFAQGRSWRDFAILYRMNAQSNSLEVSLKRNDIPYRIFGGTSFFDRAEIKDMMAYLLVIANPEDNLRLSRVINTPVRGIGATTLEAAVKVAAEEGISVFEAIKNASNYPELQRAAARLAVFTNLIDDMRALLDTVRLDDMYDLLIDRTGYIRALESKDVIENVSRIENVRELKSTIVNYINTTENPTLYGFLDEMALYTDLEELDDKDDYVALMTMHSAKGLEFPTVFITGAEDGIFPSLRSIGEPEEIEEERRLCYVAMTRAMEKLIITCTKQRMLFGRTTSNLPSRFLLEIPDDTIDKPPEPLRRNYNFSFADGDTPSSNGREYPIPGGSSGGYRTASRAAKNTSPLYSAETAPVESFSSGDRVRHNAFGEGKIISVKPVGGDALMEIDFGDKGRKRLMLKTASQFMKKL